MVPLVLWVAVVATGVLGARDVPLVGAMIYRIDIRTCGCTWKQDLGEEVVSGGLELQEGRVAVYPYLRLGGWQQEAVLLDRETGREWVEKGTMSDSILVGEKSTNLGATQGARRILRLANGWSSGDEWMLEKFNARPNQLAFRTEVGEVTAEVAIPAGVTRLIVVETSLVYAVGRGSCAVIVRYDVAEGRVMWGWDVPNDIVRAAPIRGNDGQLMERSIGTISKWTSMVDFGKMLGVLVQGTLVILDKERGCEVSRWDYGRAVDAVVKGAFEGEGCAVAGSMSAGVVSGPGFVCGIDVSKRRVLWIVRNCSLNTPAVVVDSERGVLYGLFMVGPQLYGL